MSLGTKFPNKVAIMIFLKNFAQKGYSRSKKEKVNIPLNFTYSNYARYQISSLS